MLFYLFLIVTKSHVLTPTNTTLVHLSTALSVSHLLTLVLIDPFQSETGGEEAGGEEEHVELFTTPTTKMGAATSDFGYNLFRALASREAAGNVFLAPITVSAALTQLSMGEDTNTQTQSKLVLWF